MFIKNKKIILAVVIITASAVVNQQMALAQRAFSQNCHQTKNWNSTAKSSCRACCNCCGKVKACTCNWVGESCPPGYTYLPTPPSSGYYKTAEGTKQKQIYFSDRNLPRQCLHTTITCYQECTPKTCESEGYKTSCAPGETQLNVNPILIEDDCASTTLSCYNCQADCSSVEPKTCSDFGWQEESCSDGYIDEEKRFNDGCQEEDLVCQACIPATCDIHCPSGALPMSDSDHQKCNQLASAFEPFLSNPDIATPGYYQCEENIEPIVSGGSETECNAAAFGKCFKFKECADYGLEEESSGDDNYHFVQDFSQRAGSNGRICGTMATVAGGWWQAVGANVYALLKMKQAVIAVSQCAHSLIAILVVIADKSRTVVCKLLIITHRRAV